jgi:hypothetical protein
MGAKFSALLQNGSRSQRAFCTTGNAGFSRDYVTGCDFDYSHPFSAEVEKMRRAIALLPLWVFIACYGGEIYLLLYWWYSPHNGNVMATIRVYSVYYGTCMRINTHYIIFGKHNRDILVRAYTADSLLL